jgi:RHS repeat-associated protein
VWGTLGTYTWGSSASPSTTVYSPVVVQGAGVYNQAAQQVQGTAAVGPVQATATDALGDTTAWLLDAQGRPLVQTAADGGVTTWTWGNGYLATLTDPDGRTTTYQRDPQGYATLTYLPGGATLGYLYEPSYQPPGNGYHHGLLAQTDEDGHTTTYQYDPLGLGHLTTQINAKGETSTFAYDGATGLRTRETDPLGHATTSTYDVQRRLSVVQDALTNKTTYVYDPVGNLTTTTDARGGVSTTSYDVMGRLTQQQDQLGDTTGTTYDAAGLELTRTDPRGNLTSLVYDPYGRGLVASTLEAFGSPDQRSTLSLFDAAGRTVGERNADGWWTFQALDPVGRVTQTTDAQLGKTEDYYDYAGQLLESRDEDGRSTTQVYDPRGRVTSTTDGAGATTGMQYDAAGNETSVTDPLTHVTTYGYDQLNRQTLTIDPAGHSAGTGFDRAGNVTLETDFRGNATTYSYDPDNRRTNSYEPVTVNGVPVTVLTTTAYDAVDNVTLQTDGARHTVTYDFDLAERRTAVHDGLGHTATTNYDRAGDVTNVIDALGKVTTYLYDGLNRQTQVTDPLAHSTTTVLDPESHAVATIDPLLDVTQEPVDSLGQVADDIDGRGDVTRRLYDAAGNLVLLTDPDQNTTTWVYDGDNRELFRYDPLGAATTTLYDAAGRVTSVTDRDHRQTTYSYDNDDRKLGETWRDPTGLVVLNTLTFAYDNNGNLTLAADQVGGAAATVTRGYDERDRLTAESDVIGTALSYTLTYSYDGADRLTGRQDSLGGLLTSAYDNADRLTSRQLSVGGLAQVRVDLGYNNRDDLMSLTRYAGATGVAAGTTAYGYDDARRVTAITHRNGLAAPLSSYSYGYDNADRVTSEGWQSTTATGTQGGTHLYNYDTSDQLTLADGTAYTYDLAGNRLSAGASAYQTGPANRVSTDGVYTYTYDFEGNQKGKVAGGASPDTWVYGYDQRNMLSSVVDKSDGVNVSLAVTYSYDALGRRVEEDRWQGGVLTVTYFAFDGDQVLAEVGPGGAVRSWYVWGDGANQLLARADVGLGVRWPLADRLGSVRDVTVGTGGSPVLDHLEYGPFGTIVLESSPAAGGRYTYAAYAGDRGTGLSHTPNREYAAATGTWQQEDPISFDGGDSNLHRYVGNGPTNAIDPSGLEVYLDLKRPPRKNHNFRIAESMTGLKAEVASALNALELDVRSRMSRSARPGISARSRREPGVNDLDWLEVGKYLYNDKPGDSESDPIYHNRFLWTRKGGMIDMKHLIAAAFQSRRWFISASSIREHGKHVEANQLLKMDNSAYGFEDLPSNLYGLKFAKYIDKNNLEGLPGALERFINEELGGLLPPPDDSVVLALNQIRNFSEDPILDPNGKDILTDPATGIRYKENPAYMTDKYAPFVRKSQLRQLDKMLKWQRANPGYSLQDRELRKRGFIK